MERYEDAILVQPTRHIIASFNVGDSNSNFRCNFIAS